MKPTLRERARYRFDQTMARGPIALVAWLGVVTLVLIAISAIAIAASGTQSHHTTFAGKVFFSLLHTLDPGQLGNDTGFSWGLLVAMLVLTLAGLFVVSALIGVIATGIDERLVELRKGRSRVLEDEHTLILGWSESVFTIVGELAIANESRRRPAVVILAEQDKVEMEDAIREKAGDLRGTRVVCRTGSAIDLDDLEIVNHQAARSIIVLSPAGEDPDSEVIKTVLALTRGPRRREGRYHIVAEIQDPSNLEAARLVAGDEAVIVDKRETIARLIVQTARQSGASVVYTELFDFAGDEVYFHRDERLEGRSYADALLAYEDCCVIGLAAAEDGPVVLNPRQDTRIEGHSVLVIAEDDSRLESLSARAGEVDEAAIVAAPRRDEPPSRALVLGWNDRAALIIHELDQYVTQGSELVVASELGTPRFAPPARMTTEVRQVPTSDRAALESLEVERFDQIIVLCYSDQLDAQRADARTLVTLLHLREMLAHVPHHQRPGIVSEMLDDRNRELAQVTEVDDVIVSDKILSLVIAQISENARLQAVFGDLLDADGAELYLRPAEEYVTLGAETSFATLVEAARRRDETAIGVRTAALAQDRTAQYGVRVNPPKATVFVPAAGDRVIVLAES